MDTAAKIRAIAGVFLEMERAQRKWGFLTFSDFQRETGIPKEEALPICELLKKEGLISYEFLPFDNPHKVFSVFDRERDSMDETGAISFFPFSAVESKLKPKLRSREEIINVIQLQGLVDSEQELQRFVSKLTADVSYDQKSHRLISQEKTDVIRSNNQQFLCSKIFSEVPGTIFLESDIELPDPVASQGDPARGYRADYHQLYNVIHQINKKIEGLTGTSHYITLESGRIFRGQLPNSGRS